MEGSQPSEPQQNPTPRNRNHRPRGGRTSGNRGSRGGRGGRGNRGHHGQQGVERNEASPANPEVSTASPATAPSNANSRGGGGRRASRGQRRGRGENVQRATMSRPRNFGGHLTTNNEEPGAANSTSLNADVAEFVPRQPLADVNNSIVIKPQAKSSGGRKASKSSALDLTTRISEDISNGQYECVICTNEVLRNSKVWSCSICWTATHMGCVKKWFSNRTINSDQINWRCPGCNSPLTDEPTTYHCWCGKEINPQPIPGLGPHSCGQTCSKPRATCPHPCPIECHPGPCPPCQLMGPTQSCFCGKLTSTKRCGETDYVNGWSCHGVCGDLLPCGEHECQRECHSGLCGACDIPVLSLCYCGRESKNIPCDQRGDKRESYNHGQVKVEEDIAKSEDLPEHWYWGSFECDAFCGRYFDCQKHRCQRRCHPQDENDEHCPFSPDLITHCPCGKTPLVDILDQPRESCDDPIPNCGKICNKLLSCGHFCRDTCHAGSCAPCMQTMEISCRCGRTKTTSICHQGMIATPECMRICRVQLNCGRHEHGEHCCPGEKKAMERAAARRKNRNAGPTVNEVEAEHICTRPCGRALKCGKHQCQQMCHKGPCSSCPEAIFEEISCNCGRTVLQPPQPCGTQAPECRFDCTRPRPCGHPQVSHNCHTDEDSCPKCPFLVEKRCICGKKALKNQPCWFEEPRCGLPCGKKLKCGAHTCKKTCHRLGECEDADIPGSRCGQSCGKKRTCGHLDIEQCHAPYPCKEEKPCQAKTFITCDCQRKKQEVRCMATKRNSSPQRDTIKCDDECLRLQRNALLANALNIDPLTHTDDHVPYSNTTIKLYKDDPQFAQTYEQEFRIFAADQTRKFYRFKPMKSQQRAFLHSLAEDFGFDSESADPEPHRHVCLFKTPRFVSAPMKSLAQCIKNKPLAQAPPPKPSTPANEDISMKQPFNALLLTAPQFGLTIEELNSALQREYTAYPDIKFETSFLPSNEVVIKGSGPLAPQSLESSLSSLKPSLSAKVTSSGFASSVSLCHVDEHLNVLRNEKDTQRKGNEGWSSVMRRSARPKPAAVPAASDMPRRAGFVALRREPKKKIEEQPVEEDWETAAEKLDEA
ncbi:uncharacterized protein F4812DRAFT_424813 [Daldinia caldariorum]|uniref:uncharacterized protein n=1 Tax=Daldinia caldariorum TaxID=326644 RepID=UPI0020078903|nr:uncharacterized protein F4812DRAFT_424813 [Daldinia caldariorum]KAI1468820.1 hypothetical protein F4812DRAFT_424813 [Daldinia caldariorum]